MLPTIPRYAVRTCTNAGDMALDPVAGIGTTVTEAMRLSPHSVGVDYEPEPVAHTADNVRHTTQAGASGPGQIYRGDSMALLSLFPVTSHGQVALVVTPSPYGPSSGPQWLVQHEGALILEAPTPPGPGPAGARNQPVTDPDRGKAARQHWPQTPPRPANAQPGDGLDSSGPQRVDRRPQPAHPTTTRRSNNAKGPRSQPDRALERTPDPCPPYPLPAPGSTPSDATSRWRPAGRAAPRPQPGSPDTGGRQ
nr:DNA methyltransferase [Micromonospora pallida]